MKKIVCVSVCLHRSQKNIGLEIGKSELIGRYSKFLIEIFICAHINIIHSVA